jgi:hypothetical protein
MQFINICLYFYFMLFVSKKMKPDYPERVLTAAMLTIGRGYSLDWAYYF